MYSEVQKLRYRVCCTSHCTVTGEFIAVEVSDQNQQHKAYIYGIQVDQHIFYKLSRSSYKLRLFTNLPFQDSNSIFFRPFRRPTNLYIIATKSHDNTIIAPKSSPLCPLETTFATELERQAYFEEM